MWLKVSDLSYSPEGNIQSGCIIKDIGFEVEKGDFWVILGNSGAGKTTLLQLLAGLLAPSEGRILFTENGKLDEDMLRQYIGLVFQYPEHQFFQSTVEDDISYALRQQGLAAAEIENRVIQALCGVGLDYDNLKTRSPFELSGGEQRRLAIACVLVNKPQILLLDEPIAGLDARAKKTVLSWIGRLNSDEGITVMLTTSNLEEVVDLTRNLLILNEGNQVYCGKTSEVFTQPQILIKSGLCLPPLLELSHKLKQLGYPIETHITDTEEAISRLSQIFHKQ